MTLLTKCLRLPAIASGLLLMGAMGTGATFAASERQPEGLPLVVLIAVDQFRGDYLEMYGHQWTKGLRRLMTEGAVFTQAAYPYGITKTCAGHATIGTGTVPATHGMIDNEWYDASTGDFVTCTEDLDARAIGFGNGRASERHGARWLRVPTFADQLQQADSRSRVVSMSVKARSAIGLGGRGGPNATILWLENSGTLATSSALAGRPSDDVAAYTQAHPLVAPPDGLQWDRLLPESSYLYRAPDDPASAFPRIIRPAIRTSAMTPRYGQLWLQTPFTDAYLGDLAGSLVARMRLGRNGATDMLAISFTALDTIGHRYGPRSHEVQDTLARLDVVLGDLMDMLDAEVGRNGYVLALSADHGVADLLNDAPAGVGRLSPAAIANAADGALAEAFGSGRYVDVVAGSYLHFAPGVLDRIRASTRAKASVESVIGAIPGVAHVYWADDLASDRLTDDALLQLMRRSYFPGRSGDLVYVPARHWLIGGLTANHGSPYEYDRHVPLLLSGRGIVAGRYAAAATPVDIVPTLAHLAGVRLARTDGRVLREALVER